jgi:hypothetical protein
MAGVVIVLLWWQLAHIAAVHEVKAEVARIQAPAPITSDWYAYHHVPEDQRYHAPVVTAIRRTTTR